MDDLAAAVGPPASSETFSEHAPYWTIVLVAWKQHKHNPQRPFDEGEFGAEVRYALRSVDNKELKECFWALIDARVLELDTGSDERRYVLSKECIPALERYTAAIKNAHAHLNNFLNAELPS
jgi:hypothetical protein